MTFTYVCVGIVVIILTALVTLLLGAVMNWTTNNDDFGLGPWLISVMALGAMITQKLFENGII